MVALLTIAATVPIFICGILLRPLDPQQRWAHVLALWWGRSVVAVNPFWRLRVSGRRHLRPGRAYVLVSNHQSLADIAILYGLRRQFKWLAKDSLFRVPFLGWNMRMCGYIPLERGDRQSIGRSFRRALVWLQDGMSVLVFPEGTRSRTGLLGAFKDGAFRLAIQARVPVVPIALSGTRDAIPRGSWRFEHHVRATLTILPPIETTAYAPDQTDALRERVRSAIADALQRRAAVGGLAAR